MDDIFIECPIHLDAIPIKDVLVLKCGHGFCAPCLETHFSSHTRTTGTTCPTCRKSVKRRDVFPLFLAPARPLTQARLMSSPPPPASPRAGSLQADIDLTLSDADDATATKFASFKAKIRSLAREIHSLNTRLRAAQNRVQSAEILRLQLQAEHDALKKSNSDTALLLHATQEEQARLRQTEVLYQAELRRLQDKCEALEARRMKEAESSAHAWEENKKMNEEVNRMRAECWKAERAKTQAEKDAQRWKESADHFERCVQQHKDQLALQKRKTKSLRNKRAHLRLESKAEDESLLVVRPNDPDPLRNAESDLAWLDDACAVQGDRLDLDDEDRLETEESDSDDELLIGPVKDERTTERGQRVAGEDIGNRERPLPHDRERPTKSLARFPSDWGLGQELLGGSSSSGLVRKRKHSESRPGGTRTFRVKADIGSDKLKVGASLEGRALTQKPGFPLKLDRWGHAVGTVAVGSRQKLNSKN